MLKTYSLLSICLVMLPLATSAQAAQVGLAAKVNGTEISRTRFETTFESHIKQRGINVAMMQSPDALKQLKRQILDLLIGQELLWQQAKKDGFVAASAQVDQAVDHVRQRYGSEEVFLRELKRGGFTEDSYRDNLKQELSVRRWAQETIAKDISVSAQEVHDFYQENPDRFMRPDGINARHVLIKVDPGADETTVTEARKQIEKILAEAKQGADFAALAQKHSQGPSAPKGGELGFLPRGRLVKPFEEAAFALKPGEISDVVRTHYGFHIIKLEARRGGDTISEKEAESSIRNHLSSMKTQEAIQERVRVLRETGNVEILLPL
ncbi:MAG: peptidylprolyl isomerase [Planctomycetota bacterium]